jgi:hypothetical protein
MMIQKIAFGIAHQLIDLAGEGAVRHFDAGDSLAHGMLLAIWCCHASLVAGGALYPRNRAAPPSKAAIHP